MEVSSLEFPLNLPVLFVQVGLVFDIADWAPQSPDSTEERAPPVGPVWVHSQVLIRVNTD